MEAASTTSSVTSSQDGRGGGSSDYINLGMFSSIQQPGGSDTLSGGFLGNGFRDDNVTSGTSFDLNDFPSLAGAAPGSGNGLAQALRQQQQLFQQQQLLGANKGSNLYRGAMTGQNGNFSMATEDFPALSGAPSGSGANGTNLTGSSVLAGGLTGGAAGRGSSGAVGGMYGSELEGSNTQQLDGSAGLLGGAGLGGLGGLRNLQSQSSLPRAPSGAPTAPIGTPTSGTGSAVGNALSGDYGLLGLLGVIRMTDADRNALALGSDLTLLGLNLGSTEQIYSTFSSPWSESLASTKEPHYQLPSCYYMQPPALKTGHLSKFQLETLFYIFYALPKDVLQAYAAQELYTREWRYHGDLKLWFKRVTPSDGVQNASTTSPQYLYFDINTWERRLFNGNIQNITSGFLPEEEVRVKFPNS